MNFSIDLVADIALSIIGIGISILAIAQTSAELKCANKQAMFDRRLDFFTFVRRLYHELDEKKGIVEKKEMITDVEALEYFLSCDCLDTYHLNITEILDRNNRAELRNSIRRIKECDEQFRLLFTIDQISHIENMLKQYNTLWETSLKNSDDVLKALERKTNDSIKECKIREKIIALMNTLDALEELDEFVELQQKIKLYQPKTWLENLDEKTARFFKEKVETIKFGIKYLKDLLNQ